MTKRLCVLQVAPENPNPNHVELFKDKEECDFYFVTHDAPHKEGLKFCPNTRWADTRNILAADVPREYEYYAFVDYDYILRPQGSLNALEQVLEDLRAFEPAVLTYYPGNNLETPYARDEAYKNSRDYSCIPFTHAGLKIVHHSLMKWFFPMTTNFSSDIDSCHMFNIQEIPFLRHVICSHKMLYDNGYSDENADYNKDGAFTKYKMDEMWKWLRPAFKKTNLIDSYTLNELEKQDSLCIKNSMVGLFKERMPDPIKSPRNVDYFSADKIKHFFDLTHEHFINIEYSVKEQYSEINKDIKKQVENYLRNNVSFEDLKTKFDPWPAITEKINNLIDFRNITSNECVEIFQKMENNPALFIKNAQTNPLLHEYLSGKRVAFVGPAPYLNGKGKGKLIDSYDVVVRIQPEIWDVDDFGSRTDIIQSCLNSSYSPKVAKYLEATPEERYPKFIICNDTVSREVTPNYRDETFHYGNWWSVVSEYDQYLKKYGVPLAHLKNEDDTWERWALYWEVYAKPHIEKIESGLYTEYSGNFNSGYGSLNVLLSCPLKELAVFGADFYNFGIVRGIEDKYNPAYIKAQGHDGGYLGPDKILHDQLSQMMHCKNVLEKDPRFNFDEEVRPGLYSESLSKRIDMFKKLPKILHETQ